MKAGNSGKSIAFPKTKKIYKPSFNQLTLDSFFSKMSTPSKEQPKTDPPHDSKEEKKTIFSFDQKINCSRPLQISNFRNQPFEICGQSKSRMQIHGKKPFQMLQECLLANLTKQPFHIVKSDRQISKVQQQPFLITEREPIRIRQKSPLGMQTFPFKRIKKKPFQIPKGQPLMINEGQPFKIVEQKRDCRIPGRIDRSSGSIFPYSLVLNVQKPKQSYRKYSNQTPSQMAILDAKEINWKGLRQKCHNCKICYLNQMVFTLNDGVRTYQFGLSFLKSHCPDLLIFILQSFV